MDLQQRDDAARARLAELAREAGLDVEAAPIRRTSSRFCLGVEHGDYNGTELFGVGTDRFLWLASKPNDSGCIRLVSGNFEQDGVVVAREVEELGERQRRCPACQAPARRTDRRAAVDGAQGAGEAGGAQADRRLIGLERLRAHLRCGAAVGEQHRRVEQARQPGHGVILAHRRRGGPAQADEIEAFGLCGRRRDPPRTHERIEHQQEPGIMATIRASCTDCGDVELTTADVTGSWAGLRPLVASGGDGRTADLSRMHRVRRSEAGLVTITGGKLTTYREMAADTVDEVVEHVHSNDVGFAGWPGSSTAKMPLIGTAGYDTVLDALDVFPEVPAHTADHLASRYGGEARALMAMIQQDPALADTLVDGLPYVAAEAVFAARHEMAGSVSDVLSRRTRARIFARDDSLAAARRTAELIAPELGWDASRVDAEVDRYAAEVQRERASGELPETHLASLGVGPATRGPSPVSSEA